MTSTIKVNTITTESGSTLTVGGCGKTVALASGASQTGFGRTGTVDWQTGSIKTGTFSATNGEGYFVNTAGSTATANLPAGSARAIVSFADYNNNFNVNKFTITPNGSDKIGGENIAVDLTTAGQSVTLVFVDSTEGWVTVNDSSENIFTSPFIVASGGTETECGNFKIHTFTGPGTFTVASLANCSSDDNVDYLVVGGGAAGGIGYNASGGGGGAGGLRFSASTFTAPPTSAPRAGSAITATVASFPITVGAGGTVCGPGPSCGVRGGSGTNSVFSTITSAGGGGGGGYGAPIAPGNPGGSGGGGGGDTGGTPGGSGGTGNTPPVSPPQGNNGGAGFDSSPWYPAGGGGGAGGAGSSLPAPAHGGPGGDGLQVNIDTNTHYWAGGGGGAAWCGANGGNGGLGGGGGGASKSNTGGSGGGSALNTGGAGGGSWPSNSAGGSGGANTGAGAGGNNCTPAAKGNGGSGIVIIRYRFQ